MSFPFRTTRFDQTKCTKILRRKLYHRAVHLSQLTGEGGTANSENAINTWRNPTTPRAGSHQARDVGGQGWAKTPGNVQSTASLFSINLPLSSQDLGGLQRISFAGMSDGRSLRVLSDGRASEAWDDPTVQASSAVKCGILVFQKD